MAIEKLSTPRDLPSYSRCAISLTSKFSLAWPERGLNRYGRKTSALSAPYCSYWHSYAFKLRRLVKSLVPSPRHLAENAWIQLAVRVVTEMPQHGSYADRQEPFPM